MSLDPRPTESNLSIADEEEADRSGRGQRERRASSALGLEALARPLSGAWSARAAGLTRSGDSEADEQVSDEEHRGERTWRAVTTEVGERAAGEPARLHNEASEASERVKKPTTTALSRPGKRSGCRDLATRRVTATMRTPPISTAK